MKRRTWTWIGLVAGLVALLAAGGCVGVGPRIRIGELQTESRSVERGDADSVRVQIEMGAGDLQVSGGADGLLAADFTYNVAEFQPEVNYEDGLLVVRQPAYEGRASLWDVDDYRYEWDLRLNDNVPIEMSVEVGAGRSSLDLGRLSLTELQVDTGAGEVRVDLRGATALSRFEVRVGAGQLTADLTGDWQQDLDARIEGGVGEATLRLPREAGVRVEVQGGLGSVNANGFTRDGDAYVNQAYGSSDVTLRIDVEAGVGAINLELGE